LRIKRVKLVYAFSNITIVISHAATPFLNVSSPTSYPMKKKHVKRRAKQVGSPLAEH